MNTDDKICAICYENEEEEKLIKLEPSSFNRSFLTTGGPSSISTRLRNANNQFDERELLMHQD
jgi:hypothetical protein